MERTVYQLKEWAVKQVLEELLKKEAISEILPLPEIGYQNIYNLSNNATITIKKIDYNFFEYVLEVG